MKKEKTKRARKKSSTTITLVQPLLIKRSATDTNFPEPPSKYQRTHSAQSVSTAALRKQTLTQKKQEKIIEEQTHERLCKELQFLSIKIIINEIIYSYLIFNRIHLCCAFTKQNIGQNYQQPKRAFIGRVRLC